MNLAPDARFNRTLAERGSGMDVILWSGAYILALSVAIALLALLADPGRPLNRIIAAMLFSEGLSGGLFRLVQSWPSEYAYAGRAVGTMAAFALVPLYLLFLGITLKTPLVAPWRRLAVRRLLYAILIIVCLLPVFVPATFSGGFARRLNNGVSLVAAAAVLYSFAAALHAFLRSQKSSLTRRNTKWYLASFAVRDLLAAPLLIVMIILGGSIDRSTQQLVIAIGFAITATLYAPLLAYAMIRGHMFDIDLKIKWAFSRGTVAALFLACFLIVAKLAEAIADRYVGGQAWVLGAVAAGLLLFALTPLQRLAERLADQAMPKTTGSPEYLLFKKLEVYRSTAESVLLDGSLSARDRRILDALREKLDIDPAAAEALERDAGVPRAQHVSRKTAAA